MVVAEKEDPVAMKQGYGTLPELLAPAGNWECAHAAVENGADAIYFGLGQFNARMRAQNFTEADLPELVRYLHRRGVRAYVTLNTLIFANELAAVERQLLTLIRAGVDAVIVQDIGLCRLIRKLSPDFPIHASTQMTVTSAAGVEFARELGCQLVVLARENSIQEIQAIQQSLRSDSRSGAPGSNNSLPLEVFVHGALCVAYSGQCLTSESVGGRSANRGECAQACRMPYDLIADGNKVTLGDRQYLLSPQDLAGLEALQHLAHAEVASLKIEGRLKTPEYVASVTRVYRRALDQIVSSSERGTDLHEERSAKETERFSREAEDRSTRSRVDAICEESRYELEMAFSRGLYPGWLRGINNQELVHGRFGTKRGAYLGEVTQVGKRGIWMRPAERVKRGDGIVFDHGRPEKGEQGGRIYEVRQHGRNVWLSFGRGQVDLRRVHAGDRVWKTSDPELRKELRKSFEVEKPQRRHPVWMEVHGAAQGPMSIVVRDRCGHVTEATSSAPLESAANQPLTRDRLWKQLSRLGGTPFYLEDLADYLEGELILPLRELNALRRAAIERLEAARAQPSRWTLALEGGVDAPADEQETSRPTSIAEAWVRDEIAPESPQPLSQGHPLDARLVAAVRNEDQLEGALAYGARSIYCEFEEPKRYREAVRRFNALRRHQQRADPSLAPSDMEIFVAPARITKPGEDWILRLVRRAEADGYLVRNYDHLRYFKDCRKRGDFSLNVANPLTADYFVRSYGLETVTASYDLNITQLEALLRTTPPEWLEITIHQHMPMFHMEHCVFCAFLSNGTDYTNCGRPCDHYRVELRDRIGAAHPLKADVGCRNTVYNARAQSGSEYVAKMQALGARRFRVEFLNETREQVEETLSEYGRLLRGEITGTQLWKKLKLVNQLGVTRGQMERRHGTDRE